MLILLLSSIYKEGDVKCIIVFLKPFLHKRRNSYHSVKPNRNNEKFYEYSLVFNIFCFILYVFFNLFDFINKCTSTHPLRHMQYSKQYLEYVRNEILFHAFIKMLGYYMTQSAFMKTQLNIPEFLFPEIIKIPMRTYFNLSLEYYTFLNSNIPTNIEVHLKKNEKRLGKNLNFHTSLSIQYKICILI